MSTAAPALATTDLVERPFARCEAPLERTLATLVGAAPELLGERPLLRRVDTKLLLDPDRIAAVIAALRPSHAVLRLPSGGAIATYRSLYFDTPDLACFHDHRRGRRIRHKVRIRHYPDRAVSFLELKTRRSEHLTFKRRIEIPYGHGRLDPAGRDLLPEHLGPSADDLRPQLWIDYRRITLIGMAICERVTIDLDVTVTTLAGTRTELCTAAVLEIKQDRYTTDTPAMRAVATAGARAGCPSKYIAAIAATRPGVRCNRLLPTLRSVERSA